MLTTPECAEPDEKDPWDGDVLSRCKIAEFLTPILTKSHGPLVLNIDSPWGTGKTFFLRRWAMSLKAAHPVVYFSAWETDYVEEPLVAFLAECHEQLSAQNLPAEAKQKLQKLGKNGMRVARGLVPLLVKAIGRKALGDEGLGEVKDLLDDDTEKDTIQAAADLGSRWLASYAKEKSAIAQFRTFLEATVEAMRGSGLEPPLLVFVDELDRCRPTYAIRLLERIKHIFGVKGVIFVLGTDATQLGHSLGAVYGQGFDSAEYLRRFIDQTYTLPRPDYEQFATLLVTQDEGVDWSALNSKLLFPEGYTVQEMFAAVSRRFDLTLRQQQQCYARLRLARLTWDRESCFPFLATLIAIRTVMSLEYANWRRGGARLQDLGDKARDRYPTERLVPGGQASRFKEFWDYTKLAFQWVDDPNLKAHIDQYRERGDLKPRAAIVKQQLHDFFSAQSALRRHVELVELTADLS